MTPRRPSFRSTLAALSHAFVDAVLLAVRRAALAELAGALGPAPAKAPPATRKARQTVPTPQRSKAAPASLPTRPSRARSTAPPRRQLELPLDLQYPETAIVDPDAVLRALSPAAPVVAVGDASADVPILTQATRSGRLPRASRRIRSPLAPADGGQAPAAPQRARDPVPRAGEAVLRAAGGGAVLRRRRAPIPSSPPTGTAE